MFKTPDADVARFMRMLTFMPLEEVARYERARAPRALPPQR